MICGPMGVAISKAPRSRCKAVEHEDKDRVQVVAISKAPRSRCREGLDYLKSTA